MKRVRSETAQKGPIKRVRSGILRMRSSKMVKKSRRRFRRESVSSRCCRSQTSPRTSSLFVCRLLPRAVEDRHTCHDEMRALPAPREMSELQRTVSGYHIRGRGLQAAPHLHHQRGLPRQALPLSLPSRSFPNPRHHRNLSQLPFSLLPSNL